MRNAEIAAALRELGILYELDGADRFRVLAYREAARTIAQSPVSIEQLAEENRNPDRDGQHPVRGQAEGEVPRDPGGGDAGARPGSEDRPPDL
jgi:hypothetical protein